MAPALAWGVFVVFSTGYLLRCIIFSDDETYSDYIGEKRRANELETLLVGTLRFGCDSMEDVNERLEAGESISEIADPNIMSRRELETERWAVRAREGTETELDHKTRQRLIQWRTQRIEHDRMIERKREEFKQQRDFWIRIIRLLTQTFGPVD